MLRNYASQFPIYTAMTLSQTEGDYRFKRSNRVEKEGVYYFVMVYASHNESSSANITNMNSVYGDFSLMPA